MGNTYTGSDVGKGGLEVTEVDGAPDVRGVTKITVSNGTLTDDGGGEVTITTGGGGGGTIGGTIANTQVAYGTAVDTIGGDAGLIWTNTPGSRRLTLTDTSAGTMVQVESTDAGGGTAPDVVLYRNSATPIAGDDLGVIVFRGNDSVGAAVEYGRVVGDINTTTAGNEDGEINIRVVAGGALGNQFRVQHNGVFVNPAGDSDTDFICYTDTVANAFVVDASADAASFDVPLTVAAGLITLPHIGPTQWTPFDMTFAGGAPLVQDFVGIQSPTAAPLAIVGWIPVTGTNSQPGPVYIPVWG